MKRLYILLVALVAINTANTQGCLPEGITFTTQEQIDNFQTNYPGCTEIEGDVFIGTNVVGATTDITNLNGLNVITNIGGDLEIEGNDSLSSIQGLNNLVSITGNLTIGFGIVYDYNIIFFGNPSLINLEGLESLTSIGGNLVILANDSLASFEGLQNLVSVGGNVNIGIYFALLYQSWGYGNPSLTSLEGLEGLISIGGELWIIGNAQLTSLNGLSALNNIGGIGISQNNSLTSLNGLDNMTSIGGGLFIDSNPVLSNLAGLENVTSIEGNLGIFYNAALTNLTGLENLTSIGGSLKIGDINGDNNSLNNLTGLEGLTTITGNLYIYHNDALTSLSGLDNLSLLDGDLHIGRDYSEYGNPALTDISSLGNLTIGSINNLLIGHNSSLSNCDAQSICDYLTSPNGTIEIYYNAPGCNNPPEVAASCGFVMPCLPYGNYYFFNQNEIDSFQTNYPNCSEIEGNVYINGVDITNLNGLNVLTSIGGDLTINNSALTSLMGLEGVTSIDGSLSVGPGSNPALTSLEGLNNLTSIGGSLNIGRYLGCNPALNSLTGLNSLTTIGGKLYIDWNNSLTSLSGLDNIDAGSITSLMIINNTSLSTCHVQSICDFLASPNGQITISGNAYGCDSQDQVEAACDAVGVENVVIENEYTLFPNPANQTITITTKDRTTIQEVIIYNQSGQKVLQGKPVNNTLDVSKLKLGMYIIEVKTIEGNVREKLIIQ